MTPNQKEQFEFSAQDKIRVAVSIVGHKHVWGALYCFCGEKSELMEVETDGSIYNEDTGRYLSETELEEFVEYCEKENA